MKVVVDPDDVLVRKADSSGRIAIGASKHAGKKVTVAILETHDEEEGCEE